MTFEARFVTKHRADSRDTRDTSNKMGQNNQEVPSWNIDTQSATDASRFLIHNYTDRFFEPIQSANDAIDFSDELVQLPSSFPGRLYMLLQRTDEEETGHIVSWQPHGRCLLMKRQEDFVNLIMPRYFKTEKFSSFRRQLNLYGFSRLSSGQDKGGYFHEYFLRGRPDLLSNIKRLRVNGSGTRKISVVETEPNFYRMPFCFDSRRLENLADSGIGPVSSSHFSTATNLAAASTPTVGGTNQMRLETDMFSHYSRRHTSISAGDSVNESVKVTIPDPDPLPFDTTVAAAVGQRTQNGVIFVVQRRRPGQASFPGIQRP